MHRYVGIRKQCMELVGSTSLASGGVYKNYNTFNSQNIVNRETWRPGMAVYRYNRVVNNRRVGDHAMILSEIEWSNNNPTGNIRVVETNWGTTFNNPLGQTPWQRTVTRRDVTNAVFVRDYYNVVNLDR